MCSCVWEKDERNSVSVCVLMHVPECVCVNEQCVSVCPCVWECDERNSGRGQGRSERAMGWIWAVYTHIGISRDGTHFLDAKKKINNNNNQSRSCLRPSMMVFSGRMISGTSYGRKPERASQIIPRRGPLTWWSLLWCLIMVSGTQGPRCELKRIRNVCWQPKPNITRASSCVFF